MPTIDLSFFQLCLSSLAIVFLAGLLLYARLNMTQSLVIAAMRSVIQLLLIGLILAYVFETLNPWLIVIICGVMILTAGHEIGARQKIKMKGFVMERIGVLSLLSSSVVIALFTVGVILQVGEVAPHPFYDPRYLIPLLGMILGNTMTGIALGMDRLSQEIHDNIGSIEAQLLLGATPMQCVALYRRNAVRASMIPIINMLSVTGIVSLPGMMTGQILAGNDPTLAAKYQIMIMFLISAGAGIGSVLATRWLALSFFDKRMRLKKFLFQSSN